MKAARTATVCLILAGIGLAAPSFQLGTKLTWRGDAGKLGLVYDRLGRPLVIVNYDREFVGATAEVTYGPLWNVLSGRIDLYQIRVYPDDGFIQFFLLPMFGLDLMAQLPVDWRVKPYVWVGARAPAYIESFASSPFELPHGLGTHWSGGLGASWRLNKRTYLFAEAQSYSSDIWRDCAGVGHAGSITNRLSGIETTGLIGVELGVRFALGR